MASPYAAGGGGTHLEARVTASYLAAVLCEALPRGLLGEVAHSVRTQRADFGNPLDDIIVEGQHHDGRVTRLELQIKKQLSFTQKDDEWIEVVQRAWDTFSQQGFDPVCQRIGAGTGVYNARADQHYQTVLNWAEHSASAKDFFERIEKKDFSHKDRSAFVTTVRSILNEYVAPAPSDDEVWRFIKSFVIIHFDFETSGSSRDAVTVIERLKNALPPEERPQAPALWDHLVAKAGELIPTGGSASRGSLLSQLQADGYAIESAPSFVASVDALHGESLRALDDIKTEIRGLRLHRATAHRAVALALEDGRFIQIDGEPGVGKSALLKEFAEECGRSGPLLVLKDNRIHPRGWGAHAHIVGASTNLVALLREFACAGEPILFIDGIDKIVDPAVQLTINDLIRAIAANGDLAQWRILATIREQNLDHLKTWLDQDAMRRLPIRTVRIDPLEEVELSVVAEKFPHLAPLLLQGEGPDLILKRPFFLNALLGLSEPGQEAPLPATEVELLQLWWQFGGADRKDPAAAQRRRNLLYKLADALLDKPNAPVAVHSFDPDIVDQLRSAGVLRDKKFGHSVEFAHDIFEEWALCEFLIGRETDLSALLKERGEPDALVRPVQLLGAFELEVHPTAEEWKDLLADSGEPSLRPVWQRAILASSLQSTRTTSLLEKLSDYLLEDDATRLRKLVLALTTLEVVPNPLFLDESLSPGLPADKRATFAGLMAVPKLLIWARFLNWFMPLARALPPSLIPDTLPVFSTWQNSYGGQKLRFGREIGEISYSWLEEFEKGDLEDRWESRHVPFGGVVSGDDIEKRIRALFLSSAGDVPTLAAAYLRTKAIDKYVHVDRREIIRHCGALVRHVPTEFVDYVLAAFTKEDAESGHPFRRQADPLREDFGIEGEFEFYPASPLQLPFLPLLRTHTAEALRLIHGLCNHAIRHWREDLQDRRPQDRLTPVAIDMELPWGAQSFWGDGRVYEWFRAVWGNNVLNSALMALEQWALEQLDEGGSFDEVFRLAIEGNQTVAVLGIGVSLCIARSGGTLACAYPLITCPQLWKWDLVRAQREMSATHSNVIGNWQKDRVLLEGVAALNKKPHRKHEIRNLIPYMVFSDDPALLEAYTAKVRDFSNNLPIEFEEAQGDEEYIAELREQMRLFSEHADPQYWKSAPTPDGQFTQLWSEPPSLKSEHYKAQNRDYVRRTEFMTVAIWADKSLKADSLDETMSLADCLAKAKEWDASDIFDSGDRTSVEQFRPAAVAGVACAAAMYAETEMWTEDLAAWCLDVIERAATGPEQPDHVMVRESVLLFAPTIFAVHAYSALLARGEEPVRCQRALLSLATDAMTSVQQAVVATAYRYARSFPLFYWTLFGLFMRQCIVARGAIPNYHASVWDRAEAEQKLELLEHCDADLAAGTAKSLPRIPLPWLHTGRSSPGARSGMKGYERNDLVWLYHIAGKVLPEFSLELLLENADRRPQVVLLAHDLLEYTLQEIVPPYSSSRRDQSGNVPFEWVFTFSRWCGGLLALLKHDEATPLLARIHALDNETALLMLQHVMRQFMIDALLKPQNIRDDDITMWQAMVGWIFANPEWRPHRRDDYLDNEFTSCAFLSMFCATTDFSGLICGVDPGWTHLGRFLPLIERAVSEFGVNRTLFLGVTTFFKRGGADLLPEPGLIWLHAIVVDRKNDKAFWDANGEELVELFRKLILERGGDLAENQRKRISEMADLLVDNGVRGAGFVQQELMRSRAA